MIFLAKKKGKARIKHRKTEKKEVLESLRKRGTRE